MVDPDKGSAPSFSPARLAVVIVLLAAPVVALMWVSSYSRTDPTLFGFPFFYWYQFLWVFLAAACTSTAYQLVVVHERRRRAHRDATAPGVRPDEGGRR